MQSARSKLSAVVLLVACVALTAAISVPRLQGGSIAAERLHDNGAATPSTANCSERFFTQPLDHFKFAAASPPTFQQRYYVCNEQHWQPNQPIFFYTGNEASVELYVNMTGLMWENAGRFGALLVFAELRYFGKSLPFPDEEMPAPSRLVYLTVDQALADYANLVYALRHSLYDSPKSAVVAFGGSFGGMLASWMRVRYPEAIDGAIAGSAPVVNFEGLFPSYDPDSFVDVVTFDASSAGGADDRCKENIRQAWQDMFELGRTGPGRVVVSSAFRTCSPLVSSDDVLAFANWASGAFPNMAMSSYPYPSAYLLLGGEGVLPAYPMRVACKFMERTFQSQAARLQALREAVGVYYNNTGAVKCLNMKQQVNHATAVVDYLWGYLACTSMIMPYGQNGRNDMFWDAPWDLNAYVQSCRSQYPGVAPAPLFAAEQYGGRGIGRWGSNIVFSNGELDPWRPGGVLNATAPSVVTVLIADAGHHIDLMFSNPKDTPSIIDARKLEVAQIEKWIAQRAAV